jgi:hypothetical protein
MNFSASFSKKAYEILDDASYFFPDYLSGKGSWGGDVGGEMKPKKKITGSVKWTKIAKWECQKQKTLCVVTYHLTQFFRIFF